MEVYKKTMGNALKSVLFYYKRIREVEMSFQVFTNEHRNLINFEKLDEM